MKRLICVILVLTLAAMLAVSVSAAGMPRLVDAADLLTAEQEAELLAHLDQLSQDLQVDVAIVTMESCGGYSPDDVIEEYYDQYDFGIGTTRDGVVLLLSMAERDWRILSNGFAADAITLSDIDMIGDNIVSDLSAGAYMDAFMEFATLCKMEIEAERYGVPFELEESLVVSVFIGFVVAFIATGIMRSKLRSVHGQTGAREYTVPGSMKLTNSGDLYLYRTTSRIHRPRESSSGTTSSGRSGGSSSGSRNIGGGKF